jgi:two-component system, sensor histidine kinase PdtaS
MLFAKQQTKEAQIKAQLQSAKSDTTKARFQGELAWIIKFSNPAEATELANAEIKIAHQYKYALLLADGFRLLGLQQAVAKNYVKAEQNYDSCIYYAKQANSYYYQASCYSLWAGIYGAHSDFDKAIELHEKGLYHANISQDPKIIAVCSNNLAAVYKLAGRNSKDVLAMFEKALTSFIASNQWNNASAVSINLAQEYLQNKQIDLANKELNHCLQLLNEDTTDQVMVGVIKNSIATFYVDLNQLDSAKKYAIQAQQILAKLKVPDNLLESLETLMKIAVKENKTEMATQYATQVIQLATLQGNKLILSNTYKTLADIEKGKNNFVKSLQYFQLHKAWSDSVFNEKREQSIANVETKSKFIQKELATKYETEKNAIAYKMLSTKNKNLQWQKWLAILSSLLCLAIISILFFANKRKNKINNALFLEKQVVEKQAKEKEVLMKEIHHRVKNNLTMLKSLLFLQAKSSSQLETKQILAESQTRIQSMALVHKNLYDDTNNAKLNFSEFIKNLIAELAITYHDNTNKVAVIVNGTCQDLAIETAMPLALIMNELATNSFKYAFANTLNKEIVVTIAQTNNNIEIAYADNGVGLPTAFDLDNGSFGFKVISILINQLDADISYFKTKTQAIFSIQLQV